MLILSLALLGPDPPFGFALAALAAVAARTKRIRLGTGVVVLPFHNPIRLAEDFAFHSAIAEATGNPQFPRFLAFLGNHVIPRQSVRLSVDTPAERRAYLERIQHEHARIVAGISDEDPVAARRAMHEHLTRSLERYRNLAGRRADG